MTSSPAEGVTFRTTLTASGNTTGIVVPDDVIEHLGHGKRPPVFVTVNGYDYRSTVAVMGGRYLIGVSAAVRAATGLAGGMRRRASRSIRSASAVGCRRAAPTSFGLDWPSVPG